MPLVSEAGKVADVGGGLAFSLWNMVRRLCDESLRQLQLIPGQSYGVGMALGPVVAGKSAGDRCVSYGDARRNDIAADVFLGNDTDSWSDRWRDGGACAHHAASNVHSCTEIVCMWSRARQWRYRNEPLILGHFCFVFPAYYLLVFRAF